MNNTNDLSELAEQLCRLEHKVDLILESLAMHLPHVSLRPLGDPNHIDPCSQEPVSYQIDIQRNHVVRHSGGRTGVMTAAALAPTFTPHPTGGKNDE